MSKRLIGLNIKPNGKAYTLTSHANHPVMKNIIQDDKRHYPMLGVLEMSKQKIAADITQDGKARTIRAINSNTAINTLNRKPKRVGGIMLHIIELRC